MSADLVTWLRAALDEDERVARAAITEPFPAYRGPDARPGPPPGVWETPHDDPVVSSIDMSIYDEGGHSEAHAAHIARWDPARVLAEIAAKRAIIDEVGRWQHDYISEDAWYSCAQAVDSQAGEPGSGCLDDSRAGKGCDCGLDQRRARILGPLAGVYRDRPGFDPSWLD